MREHSYRELGLSQSSIRRASSILSESFIHNLLLDYQSEQEQMDSTLLWKTLQVQFLALFSAFPEIDLETARILDLGCGSNGNTLEYKMNPLAYQPWFCRALHALHSPVIGVDFGNLKGEKFESYSLDLLNPDSLSFIPSSSIDAANSSRLITSPQLIKNQGLVPFNGYCPLAEEALRKSIIPQLERILKPDAPFIVH